MIICTYTGERWTLLGETIASVLRQDQPAHEVLLVIDHNPPLVARAHAAFPSVRVVPNEEARGLSGARNTGVRRSRGSIVAFLDDDAIARPDWLRHLVGAFGEPSVMGAGGVVRPAWEKRAPTWFPPEFLWVVGASYEGLPRTSAPVRNPIGASMAFRREAFERAGSFTDGIGRVDATPKGCEETEFSIRLRDAIPDAVVLHVPDARVDHHVPAARATWRYFASRCWAEGASKALVTARVGSSSALASERSYVSRALPLGVLNGLRAAGNGDPAGLGRAAAILVGLGITAAGYAAHCLPSNPRGGAACDAKPPFAPAAVRSVELDRPLAALTAGISSSGRPYASAFVLVRLHGEPLGVETVALTDGRAEASDVAERLWSAIGPGLVARAGAAGRPLTDAGPQLLLRGLDGMRELQASSPSPEAPHITVIVPTGGRSASLDRCLKSLRALEYPHFDVLVVDNAPADPRSKQVVASHAEQDERIRYGAEVRPGSSVARNHGLARTAAEYVAFTDDDVVVEPDWLDALTEPLRRDPRIDVTTGLVLPAELETRAQWCFEEFRGFGRGYEARVFGVEDRDAERHPLYPYWGGTFGSGNSMAFRTMALRAIGGFDPALGAGSLARSGSDVEAFSRILLRGGRLTYQPRAICWHTHRREEWQLRRQLLNYGIGLTAILTKWSIRRPSLLLSIARAVPKALTGKPEAQPGQRPGLPRDLRHLELRGYMLGPAMYVRSVRWARRMELERVMTPDDQRRADA